MPDNIRASSEQKSDRISRFDWEQAAIAGAGAVIGFWILLHGLGRGLVLDGEPTAWLLPSIAAGAMAVLSVISFISTYGSNESKDSEDTIAYPKRFAWYAGVLLIFAIALEQIGFAPLVVLLLPPLLRYGEALSWRTAVIVAVVSAGAILLIFQYALGVELPPGQVWSAFV